MATPTHPNEFALRQQVLYRTGKDDRWHEGLITAVSIDDRKRHHPHGEGCDEYLYVIADQEQLTLPKNEQTVVTECQCDVMIADADATGRWYGQRLKGPRALALLLVDAKRRGKRVVTDCAVSEVDDEEDPDLIRLLEMPGYHHLASARVDDLVAWASGVAAADWKEPTE